MSETEAQALQRAADELRRTVQRKSTRLSAESPYQNPSPSKTREGDQVLPSPNTNPGVQDLVIDDIERRKQVGISRYGTVLQGHNGRDGLQDWYEELLDATVYARQLLWEREFPLPVQAITLEDLMAQISWSRETFGPGTRRKGVLQHIRKELTEIEAKPYDLEEWLDVIILAIDGASRHGFSAEEILLGYREKLHENFRRSWPNWRERSEDEAIEHNRD